jgi:hypothetical protein
MGVKLLREGHWVVVLFRKGRERRVGHPRRTWTPLTFT